MTERTHGGSVAAARLAAESACGAYSHGAVGPSDPSRYPWVRIGIRGALFFWVEQELAERLKPAVQFVGLGNSCSRCSVRGT